MSALQKNLIEWAWNRIKYSNEISKAKKEELLRRMQELFDELKDITLKTNLPDVEMKTLQEFEEWTKNFKD